MVNISQYSGCIRENVLEFEWPSNRLKAKAFDLEIGPSAPVSEMVLIADLLDCFRAKHIIGSGTECKVFWQVASSILPTADLIVQEF